MTVLFASHPRYLDHDSSRGHPERPARLEAVERGAQEAGLEEALVPLAPRQATRDELELVHAATYVDAVQRFCASGGGWIDGDTHAGVASFDAALLAAGAGLTAIERLDAGEAESAFCAVRPPGHHALPSRAMGFCLFNNVAVSAAALAARGERVVVLDYDAHHGNGTQDAFYDDPRVLYVSLHEWPLYPGTGAAGEGGRGEAAGTTVNIPLPEGTGGATYRRAFEHIVEPAVAAFEPTWLVLSAGFDAHVRDPLTGLALTSADFHDLTAAAARWVPPGHRLVFLEGGYDLEALALSTGATLSALEGGAYRPEGPSADRTEHEHIDRILKIHTAASDG